MIKTIFIIVISFFAVIGIMDCIMTLLETVSTIKYKMIKNITLTVELEGKIPDVSFLLGTLRLQAQRIQYNNSETKLVIKDNGLSEDTYSEIFAFCLENDNIFVEK